MKRITKIALLLFVVCGNTSIAQQFRVSGTVTDSLENEPLIGVNVVLQNSRDTTIWKGTVTDVDGTFAFSEVRPGGYILKMSYIGYIASRKTLFARGDLDMGRIRMVPSVTTLNSIEIVGDPLPVEQKGDSIVYNASAFKTNRDASAEELITKMPGIIIDANGIKAQGENVQQILVDGKPFFGDDPNLALKNLPAEVIAKIEVFDQLSEQSRFTGFDDGNTRKTINIITKGNRRKGEFGSIYAGAGEDGRYMAGGNINSFNGDRKMSFVGMTNNTNQQNFSSQDLLGITGSESQGRGNRGGRGGGGSANNFLVGQQGGISVTHAAGLNYSNSFGKKVEVSGSYFFNNADNERFTDLSRMYVTSRDSGLFYNEVNRATSVNHNHRLNARIEYKIDSSNTIVFTPSLSFQQNDSRSNLNGNYQNMEGVPESQITNSRSNHGFGHNFNNNVLYRHRFAKRGRSISWDVGTSVNDRDGNSGLYSLNEFFSPDRTTLIDQKNEQTSNSYTVSSILVYTEPVTRKALLQINYSPSLTRSTTDKETYNRDAETEKHSRLDTLLTNKFKNSHVVNRAGMSYRVNDKKYSLMTGINFQHARLTSDQDFPTAFQLNRAFQNVLPQVTFNYKFTSTQNFRVMYRTSTQAPSVSQLQNVIDNRNPLFLRTGNPELKQTYNHAVTLRYGKSNVEKSSSFLVFLYANRIDDYISNRAFIASKDTAINGTELNRGTQLTYPVNLEGYWSGRSLVTYGVPVTFMKCNVNINTGFNYNRVPALINAQHNFANNYTISQGVALSSNISEKIDFTLNYSANYTVVENTLQKQANNNYYNQVTSFRLNWLFYKGFVFNSNANNTVYSGLSREFNQSIWFWNASLGYKMLKNKSLEVKATAFDILNQNQSITRDVTETYIEDRQTNVLSRYFMMTATYSIRKF